MAKTPERRVKAALLDGFYHVFGEPAAWHTAFVAGPVQQAGRPDYVMVHGGRTIWVEAKANNNGLSKLQRRVMPRMVAAGARVMIVRGIVDDLSNLITRVDSWVLDPAHLDDPRKLGWIGKDAMKRQEFWDHLFGLLA